MKNIIQYIASVVVVGFASCCIVVADDTKPTNITTADFSKVGAAGGQFLKIGVGARATGMAGAYGSISNDLSSLYWNPSGIADIKEIAGSFSYTQWFGGYSHNFFGGCVPLSDKYRAGISFTSFSSGDIPVTTVEKETGTGAKYQVSDFALGLTFAGNITQQFAFGATIKYVQNAFASVSASGVAFDIGTIYHTGIQGINVGFSIQNLGGQQAYSGQDLNRTGKIVPEQFATLIEQQLIANPYNLPLVFRASVSTDVMSIINGENETPTDAEHKWIACADFETLSDVPEQYSIGTEYVWKDFVSVRAGYRMGHNTLGLAGGIGLKYIGGGFDGQLDYSISPVKEFGIVNRITIAIRAL